jgi:hypothetical protein
MVESELGIEFLGDLVLAPFGMVAGNASDEGRMLRRNAGPSNVAVS